VSLNEAFVARHRAWAAGLGLLDRPWLILGSAPDPTLPAALLASHARIDINNAGRTAQRLGLGRADLTVRAKHKTWREHRHLDTRALLWVHEIPALLLRLLLLTKPYRHIGSLRTMSRGEREAMTAAVSGVSVQGVGDWGKVTNGVAAACYGLMLGVPAIVLAGLSLSKEGHSYDDLNRSRRQVREDAGVLAGLKGRPGLATTEADLASETGLPLA
jgi:hypothetical protein